MSYDADQSDPNMTAAPDVAVARHSFVCRVCGIVVVRAPSKSRGGVCSNECRYARPPYAVAMRGGIEVALIPITAYGKVVAHAVVDMADADWLNRRAWNLSPDGYAYRSVRRRREQFKGTVSMAREILGLATNDPGEADHINRDRLDNRRANLRVVDRQGNLQNVAARGGTSRYRGVVWEDGRWTAMVKVDGKIHRLGRFDLEEEAAEAARFGRRRLLPFAVD